MDFQFVVISALGVAFISSHLADFLWRRAINSLEEEEQEAVFDAAHGTHWFWRGPDIFAMLLLVGSLPVVGLVKYPFTGLAASVAVFCVAKSAKAWLSYAALKKGAPASPSLSAMKITAAIVTVVQLAAAVFVCVYVYSNVTTLRI